ncbi:hypothetical protein [Brevundimonas sp. NIBR10]|uniref:hypothetical protein n=1 Tax=Brevundimonas sp. NIBR10 TaxID=3015997 RepID=UPI0022F198EA|nr:hypothetical protein [Brevundimonas sp. NIBR10]
MNNGTPMARMAARSRAGVDLVRVAYLAKRGLELDVVAAQVTADVAVEDAAAAHDAADEAQFDIDDTLNGDLPFTALNVGGTDVKPFLDKTDGEKLTDSTALDAGVVVTEALEANAVTAPSEDATGGTVDGKFTTQVVLATKVVDCEAGDSVILLGSCSATAKGSGTPIGSQAQFPLLRLYRGATLLSTVVPLSIINGVTVSTAPGINKVDTPGAGSFTYTLVSELTSTTDVDFLTYLSRQLIPLRLKR